MRAALGFGVSGPLGAPWFRERKALRLVAQALDNGVRHFDTAPFYGMAEERLARAIAGRADVFVSTKTGTRRKDGAFFKDFSLAGMSADVETSRKRFGRDRLDLVLLHGPSLADVPPALAALLDLKAQGKMGAVGVCGEGAALEAAVDAGADAIMGVFNFADRRHEALFRRARAAGVMTAAIAPLAQGAFDRAGLPLRPSDFWKLARNAARAPAPRAALANARRALEQVDGFTRSGAALAFVLHSGAADVAFTTTTSPVRLMRSIDAAARAPSPQALHALGLDPARARS
jgi:aryl-alcohol dehydrogenase-like predicted oxidoreductase